MLPDTVRQLSEIDNIIGLKDATGDLGRLAETQALLADADFSLFSGDDETGAEFLLRGGHGVISVTNNVAPKAMAEMCEAALSGDRELTESINQRLAGLHSRLFLESSPIPVKWALFEMGLIESGIRLPLDVLDEQYHEPLRHAMRQAEVL